MKYTFITTGCLEKNSSFVRLRELGSCIAKLGIDVYYLCDDTPYNRGLIDALSFAHIEFISRSSNKQSLRIKEVIERRTKLQKLEVDVVHYLNPSPNNFLTVVGSHQIIVCDWDELLSQRIPSTLHRIANRICEKHALQNADLNVVASRCLQTYFEDRFKTSSLYLPYATYLKELTVTSNPFEKPTAVYMGNFHHDSDHDILLDAWSILQEQNKALNLCLIGGGSEIDKVRHAIQERGLKNITLTGYLPPPQTLTYLIYAHFLLFPIRDTVGNRMRCPSKTFAYMQSGRPIVTNRVGEVAEALGEKAYYADPTPESFANIVETLFQKDLPVVSYPLENHTWESRADMLIRAVQERQKESKTK